MFENVERHIIISILKRTNGNQSAAAKELGTTKRRLQYRVLKYISISANFAPPMNHNKLIFMIDNTINEKEAYNEDT